MAIVTTDDKHYKDIANEIRAFCKKEDTYYPKDMVSGIHDVYDAGLTEGDKSGYATGFDDGTEAGMKLGRELAYDAFWESYLTPPQYDTAFGFGMFAGIAWNENNCNPNLKTHKTITPKYAAYMFAYNAYIQDLDEWCEKNNLTIDFSKSTTFNYTFYGMGNHLKSVGNIDARSANSIVNCFYGAAGLHTIKHLILKDDGSQSLNNAFAGNTSLENITISGKIGTPLTNFSESTLLTHKSLMSIIDALYDHASLTGTTRTITLGATNLAKLTDAEKAIATQKGWTLA